VQQLSSCTVTHPAWAIILEKVNMRRVEIKTTAGKVPSEKMFNMFLGFGF